MSGYRDMAREFLKSKGLSDAAVAGVLGNMMVESSFNPAAVNGNEGAVGFIQWEGGRRTALQRWAMHHHGAQETDAQSQLEFMWHELTTSYSGALDALKRARTPADAAAVFDAQYEVSAGTTRDARINYARQFYTGGGPNPAFTGPTSTGGGRGGGMPADAAASHATRDDFLNVDGLGQLLDTIPELKHLVDRAVSGNWTAGKFQNAVEDSHWWKHHSTTARSVLMQQANDPATFNQNIHNVMNSLSTLSHQLGMPLSSTVLRAIAQSAMLTGNDSNQQWLTQQIGRHEDYTKLKSTDGLSGGMATTVQQLQQMAADYGFKWSASQLGMRARAILIGSQTLDSYKQDLQTWAKSAFPGLSKQIDGGATVKDLAAPYVSSMSQLLELDPGTLDTYNTTIRRALQGSQQQGAKAADGLQPTPLWQFEQQVRKDPRWQYTSNAHQSMASTVLQLGRNFGFDG